MTLKQQYTAYIARLKKRGDKLASYRCPHCREQIEAPAPPRGQKWDSMVECPHCGNLHFKIVSANRRVEVSPVYIERARRTGRTHAARVRAGGGA